MVFRTGVANPEGPVALPDGSWAITEMDRGTVTHIGADGRSATVLAHTGRPNGLARDTKGQLWVAESQQTAVLRLTADGQSDVVSRGGSGLEFLWPNDLCFGPDGVLYLTDSGMSVADGPQLAHPERALRLVARRAE